MWYSAPQNSYLPGITFPLYWETEPIVFTLSYLNLRWNCSFNWVLRKWKYSSGKWETSLWWLPASKWTAQEFGCHGGSVAEDKSTASQSDSSSFYQCFKSLFLYRNSSTKRIPGIEELAIRIWHDNLLTYM